MKKIIFAFVLFMLIGCTNQQTEFSLKPGNEGFTIGNGSKAVLLAHGLGASPYELKDLAEYLADKNFTVQVVRLKGHGTDIKDLENTKWQDWYKEFEEAYLNLLKTKEKVYVGGMSLGGALALYLAENHETAGVISLASPVYFVDWRVKYAWLFRFFVKYSQREIDKDTYPYYYDKFPIKSVYEMVRFVDVYTKRLNEITEPVLIVQFASDYRIKNESVDLIYQKVSSENKEILWVNGTGHVLTIKKLNPSADITFEKIFEFISNN